MSARAVDESLPMFMASIAALATCIATHVGGRACLAAYASEGKVRLLSSFGYWSTLIGGLALTAVSFVSGWVGARPPGVLLLLFAVLSIPANVRAIERDGSVPDYQSDQALLRVLTAIPLLVLALSLVRAGTTQWTGAATNPSVVVWACLLLVAASVLYWQIPRLLPSAFSAQPKKGRVIWWTIAALGTYAIIGFLVDPLYGMKLGTLFVLFVFTFLLSILLAGIVILGDLIPPRAALALPGLRRTPFLTILLASAVMASMIDTASPYYDVRLLDQEGPKPSELAGQSPTEVFKTWTASNADVDSSEDYPEGARSVVPLVFVAGSGGGIRAAYWTAMVWDCLFGEDARRHPALLEACSTTLPAENVFTASGVSGSSVGLAAVRANDVSPGESGADPWFDDALDEDLLAASLMAFLFRDLPNSVLRIPRPGLDRASALERALEESLPGFSQGLLATSVDEEDAPRFPMLALNATSVEDGCRLSISAFSASATGDSNCFGEPDLIDGESIAVSATRDATQFFCPREGRPMEDIRLSTAALLSARFPFVSTAGGMTRCNHPNIQTYALDGGLFDNSGTEALSQILLQLGSSISAHNTKSVGSCIVPRLLIIDNGYAALDEPRNANRPLQAAAPGQAISAVYDGRSSAAREQAVALFERYFEDAREDCGLNGSRLAATGPAVTTVFPSSVPGPQAPLGWTLADYSREELREQLSATRNMEALADVRSWFGVAQK